LGVRGPEVLQSFVDLVSEAALRENLENLDPAELMAMLGIDPADLE
jgi:hypothetical protein